MIEIADSVYQIPLGPRNAINAYLVGDVLVDAGVRWSGPTLLRVLSGRRLVAHVLTHAHADHQGASASICRERGVPLWCGAADRAAAESGNILLDAPDPGHVIMRLQQRFWAGPGHPVARTLSEGDHVGDFVVLETPGHSPGHLALWREADRVLIAGDVITTMSLLTTWPGVHEPLPLFTKDPTLNRASIRRIAALRPHVVGVGHGPAWRDPDALAALLD